MKIGILFVCPKTFKLIYDDGKYRKGMMENIEAKAILCLPNEYFSFIASLNIK